MSWPTKTNHGVIVIQDPSVSRHIENKICIRFTAHSLLHATAKENVSYSHSLSNTWLHSRTSFEKQHNPHHRQVFSSLQAGRRGEQILQSVGYASHGKSYIPCAQCIYLPPQNRLRYKVSGCLCSDFPGNNTFPNKLDAGLHFFFHWERGDNKSRNKPRAQLKMKPEGEQRRLITKAHPFEATFTHLLFPPAEAILQSFIKKASLQRNYLKQRSYGGFRTNENKTAGN